MTKLSDQLQGEVGQILARSNIQATVSLQGSFARDTWVSGDTDLDIFAQFNPAMDRKEWKERVLPAIRNGLKRFKVVERYAEHPFLEFYVDGIRVNVVPCYDVKKGEWKSATDRTPYHTEFMKANLTEELRLEARLLKKFARGIGAYGAEIKIGGFSGMLIDTLTLYYHSFVTTITQASSWKPHAVIEIGKPQAVLEGKSERGIELIVIDPIDPNRNLASAVRPDKLWSFVAAGRSFLQNPGSWYFFRPTPPRPTRAQFAKKISGHDQELLTVLIKHPILVQDVLWGQLLKLERSIVELIRRAEFQVFRAGTWTDERTESAILLEIDRTSLPKIRVQQGPPVARTEDSQSFLERHLGALDTVRGPWIEEDRWTVEKKRRETSITDFVRALFKDTTSGLAVPKQIGRSLPQNARILTGEDILSLLTKNGFAEFLSEFLEAKPQWLRPTQS